LHAAHVSNAHTVGGASRFGTLPDPSHRSHDATRSVPADTTYAAAMLLAVARVRTP
jgi:hypothetical protein